LPMIAGRSWPASTSRLRRLTACEQLMLHESAALERICWCGVVGHVRRPCSSARLGGQAAAPTVCFAMKSATAASL
jgi:hypothetical protein